MTIAQDVATWLRQRAPAAFCDDCIAKELSLSQRQQANRVTNALGTTREFPRETGTCSGCNAEKIVTRAVRLA
jgi:hypothetical protein